MIDRKTRIRIVNILKKVIIILIVILMVAMSVLTMFYNPAQ